MTPLAQLRLVSWLEGVSFLVLLLVAMPLKYALGLPLAVRVVGSVHGLLFVAFVACLFRTALERHWPLRRALLALLASLVPWGPFVLNRELTRELEAERAEPRTNA
jgi:integral membrane protein